MNETDRRAGTPAEPPAGADAPDAAPDDGPATGGKALDSSHLAVRTRRRRTKQRSWAKRRHLGAITVGLAAFVLVVGLAVTVLTWDAGRTSPSALAATAAASATPTVVGSSPPPLDTSSGATTTGTTGPAASGSPTGSSAAASLRVSITAVGADSWTVTNLSGGLGYTVVVTDATTFPKNKTFASYQVGDNVKVTGALAGGVLTASTVAATATGGR